MTAPVKLREKSQVQELLENHDTFLFDCDGVIWLGDHRIEGVVESIELLQQLGKQVIFVTNNSTKSRRQYVDKFRKFGLKVRKEDIFGSAYASATYLHNFVKLPKDKKVWVLGEHGVVEELEEYGYEVLGGSNELLDQPFDAKTSPFLPVDPQVGAVIAGLDTKINYHRLAITLQYLRDPAVEFLATNIDSTFPQKGMILPGAGSIIESVAYSAGRQPVSCGKPSQHMLDAIVDVNKLDRARCVMVGDRLNTDMKFGNEGGLTTLLVLTGIETEDGVLANGSPDFYADSFAVIKQLY